MLDRKEKIDTEILSTREKEIFRRFKVKLRIEEAAKQIEQKIVYQTDQKIYRFHCQMMQCRETVCNFLKKI